MKQWFCLIHCQGAIGGGLLGFVIPLWILCGATTLPHGVHPTLHPVSTTGCGNASYLGTINSTVSLPPYTLSARFFNTTEASPLLETGTIEPPPQLWVIDFLTDIQCSLSWTTSDIDHQSQSRMTLLHANQPQKWDHFNLKTIFCQPHRRS